MSSALNANTYLTLMVNHDIRNHNNIDSKNYFVNIYGKNNVWCQDAPMTSINKCPSKHCPHKITMCDHNMSTIEEKIIISVGMKSKTKNPNYLDTFEG